MLDLWCLPFLANPFRSQSKTNQGGHAMKWNNTSVATDIQPTFLDDTTGAGISGILGGFQNTGVGFGI